MRRRVSRFTLIAILILSAALRLYRLDAQSLWNDEGNSARLSERKLDLILAGTASDIHPPAYYLLLHCWQALFGQSEWALRSLSVLAGSTLVLFTYLLGRFLFGEAVGLMAAFLGALSPFAIYYSQEARMYALLAAVFAASTFFLLRLLLGGRRTECNASRVSLAAFHARWPLHLALYVLVSLCGLYTHYAFPFALLVHNLIFALWWLALGRRSGSPWRLLAIWGGAQAAIAALYLPWLPVALRSVGGWSSAGQGYELGDALLNVLRVLGAGTTLPLEEAALALVGMGALLLGGFWRARFPIGLASVALYLLLPVALIFALDLYKPAWLKFLLVVLPAFHILIARGADNLARWLVECWRLRIGELRTPNLRPLVSAIAIALIGVAMLPSLHNLYFDPTYFRDDYRQIAADVAAAHRPDRAQAIVLNAPNQWEVFTYYYPDRDVYPAPYHPRVEEVESFLSPLVERYQRLFVLYWGDAESDPQRLIERWLAANAYKADDGWYGNVRLATYRAAPLPEAPSVALDARFGESIRLSGFALAGAAFAPGEILPVTLFWEAPVQVSERYKITVQLLDGEGRLVAQHDGEPNGGFGPTDTWQPGQVVVDRHGVLLPSDLPPCRCDLVVALYHVASGERLPVLLDGVSLGDSLPLGDIELGVARGAFRGE